MTLTIILCATGCVAAEENRVSKDFINTYTNPLNVQAADPYVLLHEGTYYLYATHDPDTHTGIPVYTSPDMVHWQYRGWAFRKTDTTWSQRHFWGPEVIPHDGRFVMLYNASPGPRPGHPLNMHLCIAIGDSPLGPFTELKAPWYRPAEESDEAIDQNVLIDDDGSAYLYWTRVTIGVNQIDATTLSPCLTEMTGDPVLCLTPEDPWESHAWEGHRVNEGACLIKRNGVYYLTYTGNHFLDKNYAIGYATSQSPLGPWDKYPGNPILAATPRVAGPGNGMIVPSPDGSEHFMVYHTHQSPREPGWRQLAIDRVRFEPGPDGIDRIVVDGPTHTPQALPSGAPPRAVARPDSFGGPELDRDRWMVVNERPEEWSLQPGALVVRAADGDMWRHRADFHNLFLQRAPWDRFEATVRVSFDPKGNFEQAFLCVWHDHDHYVRLSVAWSDGPRLLAAREVGGEFTEESLPNDLGTDLLLRVTWDKGSCVCSVSADGVAWTRVGAFGPLAFENTQIGIGAVAPGSQRRPEARFSELTVTLGED